VLSPNYFDVLGGRPRRSAPARGVRTKSCSVSSVTTSGRPNFAAIRDRRPALLSINRPALEYCRLVAARVQTESPRVRGLRGIFYGRAARLGRRTAISKSLLSIGRSRRASRAGVTPAMASTRETAARCTQRSSGRHHDGPKPLSDVRTADTSNARGWFKVEPLGPASPACATGSDGHRLLALFGGAVCAAAPHGVRQKSPA